MGAGLVSVLVAIGAVATAVLVAVVRTARRPPDAGSVSRDWVARHRADGPD
jgi:hypothetical protein